MAHRIVLAGVSGVLALGGERLHASPFNRGRARLRPRAITRRGAPSRTRGGGSSSSRAGSPATGGSGVRSGGYRSTPPARPATRVVITRPAAPARAPHARPHLRRIRPARPRKLRNGHRCSPSVPVAHTPTTFPVSATPRATPAPITAPPVVPSLAPRKPGDPRALKKSQAGRS